MWDLAPCIDAGIDSQQLDVTQPAQIAAALAARPSRIYISTGAVVDVSGGRARY